MASPDRALVTALRAELAAIEPGRACDRTAQVAGLGSGAIRGDRPALGRLMARLLRDAPGGRPSEPFEWNGAADHCRAAWLRGCFLARGSLSVGGGRLHLEFVVPQAEASALAVRLAQVGLPAASRVRRGRGVVTWKGAESIGTFLRLVGASAALLELESRQVSRSIRGDLNRLLNAESANLERIAMASARQVEAISRLAADGRLTREPPAVQEIARVRRATPEASLAELAAELQVPRGRVQRALERLEARALGPIDPDAPWSSPGRRRRSSGPPGPARPPGRPGRPGRPFSSPGAAAPGAERPMPAGPPAPPGGTLRMA